MRKKINEDRIRGISTRKEQKIGTECEIPAIKWWR